MAAEADHIALANRNHDTLLFLLSKVEQYSEWVAIVAFYKAVHVVEAVFAHDLQKHSSSHAIREGWLLQSKYKSIWKSYYHLSNASRIARYLEVSPVDGSGSVGPSTTYSQFSDYMDAETVRSSLVYKRLRLVEDESQKFLSPAAHAKLKRIPHSKT